jgi:hypothetical protein
MSEGQAPEGPMDDAQVEPQAPEADAPQGDAPENVESVSYDRFREVNRQKQEAARALKARERDLQALTARLEELESRDQSELEKERSKRQRYERDMTPENQDFLNDSRFSAGWLEGSYGRCSAVAAGTSSRTVRTALPSTVGTRPRVRGSLDAGPASSGRQRQAREVHGVRRPPRGRDGR